MATSMRALYWIGIISGILLASCGLFIAFYRSENSAEKVELTFESNIQKPRPNVLFIMADDMKPLFGPYLHRNTPDHSLMQTPNLDRLAGRSLVLRKAFVQQAVCGPSRTSLLTGRRPDTTRVHDLTTYWRNSGGNFTTIPQYFKEHGYRTAGIGKIFHSGKASGYDDPISWTEPYFHADESSFWSKQVKLSDYVADDVDVTSHPLQDMKLADQAVKTLSNLGQSDQPFFLALGFHRPHWPWLVPRAFYDMYSRESVRLPSNHHAPIDMPEIAWSGSPDYRYPDVPGKTWYGAINDTLPEVTILGFRRAYYTAISYVDDLMGKVFRHLDDLHLARETIIVFLSDHGYSLGENGLYGKQTVFETHTHAPLLFHIPGVTDDGVISDALVEFTDIFPTLAAAAGLSPVELCPEESAGVPVCAEGTSFLPLLRRPDERRWKEAAFSQYPRMTAQGDMVQGYTVRTHTHRYTSWIETRECGGAPVWEGQTYGEELYDLVLDPQENVNLAADAGHTRTVAEMKRTLRAGWRNALPEQPSGG